MQDASGSILEAPQEITDHSELPKTLSKARSYIRCLVGLCFCIWLTSFFTLMGSEWLHSRRHPKYLEVVPRPSHSITTLLRGSGAVSTLVGVSGWWGSLHDRYGCIVTFSSITFISSIIEISCGAVTLSYIGKTTLVMEEEVKRNLKEVADPAANVSTDNFLELQQSLMCCGIVSYRDWIKSPWWRSQRDVNSSLVIPISCCSSRARQHCNIGKPPYTEVKDLNSVHLMGCMKKISEYMDLLFYVTGCLAFVGGLLKLVGYFLMHIFGNFILRYQQQSQEDA